MVRQDLEVLLSDIETDNAIDTPFDSFYIAIIELFQASLPKLLSIVKSDAKPWITASLIASI